LLLAIDYDVTKNEPDYSLRTGKQVAITARFFFLNHYILMSKFLSITNLQDDSKTVLSVHFFQEKLSNDSAKQFTNTERVKE